MINSSNIRKGTSSPSAKTDLLQTKVTPITESGSNVSILITETEEAEELFSDIRISQYVLDIHNLNK